MYRTLPVVLFLAACNQPLTPGAERDLLEGRLTEGALVITEVHLERGGDCEGPAGQWIELTNVSDRDITLGDLDVVDAWGNVAPLDSDEVLWPGRVVTVGAGDWDAYCVDGQHAPTDYWGWDVKLDGSGVAIVHRDTGTLVDEIGDLGAVEVGTSLSLDPEHTDAGANDDPDAWYRADDCESTTGMSPAFANAPCLSDLAWFGATCDTAGCTVPADFDPVAWIETAYWIAHGELERTTDAQVEREGLYLRYVRFDQESTYASDWDPSAATWTFGFSSPDFNPFGPKDYTVELHVNDGTIEVGDDFGSDSGSTTSLTDAQEWIQVGPDPIMDDLSSDWIYGWTAFDYGVLTWPSYEDEPQWDIVSEGGWSDTRLEFSATTGERVW